MLTIQKKKENRIVINMADAAARREARRKRILENSENRLQRITGSNISSVKQDKLNNATTLNQEIKNNLENEIVPDTKSNPDPIGRRESEISDETHIGNVDFLVNNDSLNLNNDLLRVRRNVDDLDLNDIDNDVRDEINGRFSLNEKNIEPKTQSHKLNSTINKSTNESDKDINNTHDSIRRVATQESSFSYFVFQSKWILVILAAFVNVLYILQIQHICGTTILAPFFTLMLVRLHLADNKSEGQGGSMLSAALILCNIKPELVYNLRWIMKTVKKIIEEFSIYVFSFVIFYNVAFSYWNDIDITIVSAIDSAGNDGESQ